MVEQSKAEIDYERMQSERLNGDVAARQLEGWKSRGIGNPPGYQRYDGAIVPWKTYPAAATMRRDVRILLWFVGLSIVYHHRGDSDGLAPLVLSYSWGPEGRASLESILWHKSDPVSMVCMSYDLNL